MNGGPVSLAMVGWWQHPLAMEGPDIYRDPHVATLGARGIVRLCSTVEPRRRERLGGFGWDSEGGDGLPRGRPPPVFLRVDWLRMHISSPPELRF